MSEDEEHLLFCQGCEEAERRRKAREHIGKIVCLVIVLSLALFILLVCLAVLNCEIYNACAAPGVYN